MGESIRKNISKNLIGKYIQKRLDDFKQSAIDALKTSSRRVIQKTAEATGDLIDNKIPDKITKVSKINNKIIQRQSPMRMIKKYLKNHIYLQNKDRKLLMIWN